MARVARVAVVAGLMGAVQLAVLVPLPQVVGVAVLLVQATQALMRAMVAAVARALFLLRTSDHGLSQKQALLYRRIKLIRSPYLLLPTLLLLRLRKDASYTKTSRAQQVKLRKYWMI